MGSDKTVKKALKAKTKISKAKAKLGKTKSEQYAKALPEGVKIHLQQTGKSNWLIVDGLTDEQMDRVVPQIRKEVRISVTQDRHAIKAGFMRFVREGLFQTFIKIVAGLVVGYLLIRLGLR